MKLLSLEEIEKAEQTIAGQIGWRDGELFESLLDTAKAFHKLKAGIDTMVAGEQHQSTIDGLKELLKENGL